MLVEILESPVQLLDVLELRGRFFYPEIGILLHAVHLDHVAFELGLREEFGKRISGVVSNKHLLFFLHARLPPSAGSTSTAPGRALSYQRDLSDRQSQARHWRQSESMVSEQFRSPHPYSSSGVHVAHTCSLHKFPIQLN